MAYEMTLGDGAPHEVGLTRHGTRATITIDGRAHEASLRPHGDGYELTLADRTERVWIATERDTVHVHAFGRAWTVQLVDPVERARGGGGSEDVATAPMPGTVITVAAAPGDPVTQGQPLVVIESMKMQSEIIAVRDGVVEKIHVEVGDTFDRGAPLFALAPLDEEGKA